MTATDRLTVRRASSAACIGLVLASLPALAMAQPREGTTSEGTAARQAPPPGEPETTVDLMAILRGEGRGLTADAVAVQAVRTAPSVERAEASVRQASAGAQRAMWGFIPQLELSFRYTRLSEITLPNLFTGPSIDPATIDALVAGVDDPEARFLWQQTLQSQAALSDFSFPQVLNQLAFRASVTVPLSDIFTQILPAYESAQWGERAARLQVEAQQEQIALSAREAYYNYARARGALAIAQIALEQAQARHRQVQAFVESGNVARVDELRIRAQVAAAEVGVMRTRAGVEMAATAVRTLMHVPGTTQIAIGEDLLAPLPPLPGGNDQLVERAIDARQDVRALRALITSTERRVVAAEGSRLPHILVQGNLDVANPNQRVFPQVEEFRESWDVSAIVSWTLNDTLSGESQANEARALLDQARADLSSIEDGIRLQVVEATTNYTASRESLAAAQLGVEAAEESQRVQMERFRAGVSTVSDLIDASAEQIRAQLDLVNASIDARVAWARLARALGTGIPGRT